MSIERKKQICKLLNEEVFEILKEEWCKPSKKKLEAKIRKIESDTEPDRVAFDIKIQANALHDLAAIKNREEAMEKIKAANAKVEPIDTD